MNGIPKISNAEWEVTEIIWSNLQITSAKVIEMLSNNSTLIRIRNDMSGDSDIEECLDALVSALSNAEKISKN